MYLGWYQVAFERELSSDIQPTSIGELSLIIVRTAQGYRTFDSTCPHRGAHLGFGGELIGEVIKCPFHGHEIGLGRPSSEGFCIREYKTLEVGGLIFALISETHENGFGKVIGGLDHSHHFVPGFSMHAKVAPEVVMENAVDKRHFKYVHGVNNEPDLQLRPSQHGELAIEGTFLTSNPNPWQDPEPSANSINTRFFARVFSPALCLTELGQAGNTYMVLTAATPGLDGRCTLRVSIGAPQNSDGKRRDDELVRALLRDSKISFEQDLKIWEHLSPEAPTRNRKEEELMIVYDEFCRRFLEDK
jgi:3-ketosteroid 9alpha-monooxygenase subunit A